MERLVGVLQPGVEGRILRMRSEVTLEEQPHGIALQSQGWLDPNPDISQLQAAHNTLACI